ncbi:hypothetical protein AB0K00_57480, partial [Dactylosporangium sp. NPDC049525]|uniref:hypothetical protein n=1 Tax=Dactylosporangium sp. NPDC049525 TaxID=3154730 RepID=UPI003427E1E5
AAAGAGPAPADAPVDPLVDDVVAALIGLAPRGTPPPAPPEPAEVGAALRAVGATALMYLHPTDRSGRTVGVLCLDAATDRLDVAANVPVTDPLVADDPTWSAIAERWLDRGTASGLPRVLVAATGGLAGIAVPAARTGSGRRLVQELDVSRVGSGGEVVRLAGRDVRPVDADPVFVVNPRGDRAAEMIDIMVLRERYYPRSTCLGRAAEPVDGAGTATDLVSRLARATMTHLGCELRSGPAAVLLADGDVLDPGALRAVRGLVVLPPSDADTFGAVASALLAAGCTGVVGWLRPVAAPVAALAYFMLHRELVAERAAPAAAVGSVQRWMLARDRTVPPDLPAELAVTARTADLAAPALWAPLTYRGR